MLTWATRRASCVLVAGVLALFGLGVVVVSRGRDEAPAAAGGGDGPVGAGAGGARAARTRPMPSLTLAAGASGLPGAAVRVVRGGWGGAPGEFGRRSASEGHADEPMRVAVGASGELLVLDPVNRRVQRFLPDGTLVGAFAADAALDAFADNAADSAADAALDAFASAAEGRGATGVLPAAVGVYLERGHTLSVRVAGADGTPDPERPVQPGRPTRDGALYISAQIADAHAGQVIVRAFDLDARVAWERLVTLPTPIVHLMLLDSDRRGHVVLGAHVADESRGPAFDPVGPATLIVRLTQPDGTFAGSMALPANGAREEISRELALTDAGDVLRLHVDESGVEIVRYSFP